MRLLPTLLAPPPSPLKDRVHCWNNLFVVSLTGRIIAMSICWPGSTHDKVCSERVFRRMEALLDADEHVAVDGGFPHVGNFVRPLQTGEKLPADREERKKELRTSAHITTVRQAAECELTWGLDNPPLPLGVSDTAPKLHSAAFLAAGINRSLKCTFLRVTTK